ncbi:unnamed protein product [Microthlaspi erraticum]|uniref:Uncharacterized protein n=1 Tax=Microthlaspi erraticum TaxID=1685480 RepID=A0A6D2JXW4_9BRAS|nr:unnamed protein product [Microthlaspi erraticum]CAA7051223.1 unnamed protein product [Microthlaspi erraticum]
MERNGSSKLGQVLMLLLFLTILFHHTGSALPYDHEQLSVTGRRIMAYYKRNGAIGTPSSRSRRGGGGHGPHGRRLMSIYKPHRDIFTGPSSSGHGWRRKMARVKSSKSDRAIEVKEEVDLVLVAIIYHCLHHHYQVPPVSPPPSPFPMCPPSSE